MVDLNVLNSLEHVLRELDACNKNLSTIEANTKAHTMKLDQGDVAQEG